VQPIFHISFEIFHLPFGKKAISGWRVIGNVTSGWDTKRKLVQAMTNEKYDMTNGKWF
jgi:hypothetical protein